MLLSEYQHDLTAIVADLTETGLILSSELVVDFRTRNIGLVKGVLSFIDESTLYFKEYVDLRYALEKDMYSFHYQDTDGDLLFRYDNADHKPALAFADHKHINNQIIPSGIPELREVLEEIINDYL